MQLKTEIISGKGSGAAIIDRLRELAMNSVTVGFHNTGEVHPESNMVMAQHAAQLEFGTPELSIPPRPFLRSTYFRYTADVKAVTKAAAEETASSRGRPVGNLKILGEAYVGLIKANIMSQRFAPISASTMLKKLERGSPHSYDTLLDTEAMIDAIDHEVRR